MVSSLFLVAAVLARASAPEPVGEPLLSLTTAEDRILKGSVKAIGRTGLSYKVGQAPGHGSLELDGSSGAFSYLPSLDFFGGDGFTVVIGSGAEAREVVVRIDVTAVNDAPVVKPGRIVAIEDVGGTAAVPARDVDGDPLSFRIQRAPAHGKAEVDPKSGVVRFTPSENYSGVDNVTVEVSDGKELTTAELAIDVRPVNDPPSIEQLVVQATEDRPVEGAVKARDPEGDALTYRVVSGPKSGSLVRFDEKTGRFSYAPAKDTHGVDQFVVAAADGSLQSEGAIVRVEVASVNDAPELQGANLKTEEDKAGIATVTAKDIDGDAVTFRVLTNAAHGTVGVDAKKGSVTFTPAPDWYGKDKAILEVSDGTATATAALEIEVRPVNDPPVLVTTNLSTDEDKAADGRVRGTDAEGDVLRFKVLRGPKLGAITRMDEKSGTFSYAPSPDVFGEDSVVFEVADASGRGEGTVRISVRPVNDVPVVRPASLTTLEDEPVSGRIEASDVDKDTLRFRLGRAPALGDVQVDEATGAFRFVPSTDRNGTDSFTVEVSDGSARATSEVKLAVTSVNDPPKVRDQVFELQEDTPATMTVVASDPDGDAIAFRLATAPDTRLGKLEVLDAATGKVRFTPAKDANGEVSLTVEAVAGRDKAQASLQVRVLPVNDVPTVKPVVLETFEDTPVEGAVETNDIDGDALTLRLVAPPKSGEAKFIEGGKLVFSPANDFTGDVKFSLVADDGKAKSPPTEVLVKVKPANDAPLAQSGTWSLKEDTTLKERVRATDIDGDALQFAVVRSPVRGKLTLDPKTGGFIYVPHANIYGEDRFAFAASDASLVSEPAEVVLEIKPVDDPPRAIAGHFVVGVRARYEGQLEGYDPEGAEIKFRINSQPIGGTVTLDDEGTGRFTFKSDGTAKGLTSFKFSVSDGKTWSAAAMMEVTFR